MKRYRLRGGEVQASRFSNVPGDELRAFLTTLIVHGLDFSFDLTNSAYPQIALSVRSKDGIEVFVRDGWYLVWTESKALEAHSPERFQAMYEDVPDE